jgi:urease accessory protein
VFARAQGNPDSAPPLSDLSEIKAPDWLLWQLADSAFPTGGFAHSSGIEAAWQHGELRNRVELRSLMEASLWQLGGSSLPIMLAAYDQPAKFSELDDLCDCFTSNHVANRASRLQGQALLASADRIFAIPALRQLRKSATEPTLHFHLAPVFGVVVHALGVGRSQAAELFVFLHVRGLAASAVRLGIAGPMEAQSLQHQCGTVAAKVLDECQDISVEDIAQTAPLLDLWQGAQDRLYSRLFQS